MASRYRQIRDSTQSGWGFLCVLSLSLPLSLQRGGGEGESDYAERRKRGTQTGFCTHPKKKGLLSVLDIIFSPCFGGLENGASVEEDIRGTLETIHSPLIALGGLRAKHLSLSLPVYESPPFGKFSRLLYLSFCFHPTSSSLLLPFPYF